MTFSNYSLKAIVPVKNYFSYLCDYKNCVLTSEGL